MAKVDTKAGEKTPKEAAPEYTVEEFASNAKKIFGEKVNADIVTAAFFVKGIKEATVSKAKEIVKEFVTKEVK